jgi:hypothetical protein
MVVVLEKKRHFEVHLGNRRELSVVCHLSRSTFTQELYDEATTKDWNVISMKKDWKRIFAFDK